MINNESCFALLYAIEGGYVKLLLEHGTDANIRGPGGFTPLAKACQRCRGGELTKILLEHGADPLALMPNGDTVLNMVYDNRSLDNRSLDNRFLDEIIDHMVDHGLLMKLRDGRGNSALHIACKHHGSDQFVRKLLNNGLDPNLQTNDGETPLHIATESRQVDRVEMLLDRGADVSARTTDGLTALHIAADCDDPGDDDYYESDTELIRLLRRKSPIVNATDARGKTPLHYAIFDRETFELLLENGANINAEDHEGRTPLYYAIESDGLYVVELFLERGINLTVRFCDGTTPIHLAARGKGNTLQLLYREARRLGIGIDCLDANGETPLFIAPLHKDYYEEYGADEFLIDMGANLDLVYWIDRRRMRDYLSDVRLPAEYGELEPVEQVKQLAIKLSVARLLPSDVAYEEFRRESAVSEYEKELKRLKECMILRSMSLYDFLHDDNRLTAKTISRVKKDLDIVMAKFPNYRGLIESKMEIDLAHAELLRISTRQLRSCFSSSSLLRNLIIPEEIIAKILHNLTYRELNLLSGAEQYPKRTDDQIDKAP